MGKNFLRDTDLKVTINPKQFKSKIITSQKITVKLLKSKTNKILVVLRRTNNRHTLLKGVVDWKRSPKTDFSTIIIKSKDDILISSVYEINDKCRILYLIESILLRIKAKYKFFTTNTKKICTSKSTYSKC